MKRILFSISLSIFFSGLVFSSQAQFTVTGSTTNQVSTGPLWIQGPQPPNSNDINPNNGIYIGKGAGTALSSTAVGLQALSNAAGNRNTAIGFFSGNNLYGRSDNVAIGYTAMSNCNCSNSIGIGNGALSSAGSGNQSGNNIAIGNASLSNVTNAQENVAIGVNALKSATTGTSNVANGTGSLNANISGSNNAALGYYTLSSNTYTNNNVAMGAFSLRDFATTTDPSGVYGGNTGVGSQTLLLLNTGSRNTSIGYQALSGLTYGTNNLGIGSNVTLPGGVGTAVAHVNNQLSIQNVIYGINMNSHGNGNVSVATHPTAISGSIITGLNGTFSRFNIGGSSIPSLQLANVPSYTAGTVQNLGGFTGRYLFVDPSGVVCQAPLPAAQGGVASNCTTQDRLVKVQANGSTSLTCSQIYDNGTSVGIGPSFNTTSADFGYTYPSTPGNWYTGGPGSPSIPATGNVRLAVDGVTQSLAYYAYSDGRFKKNVKTIGGALKLIKSLRGVTYEWINDEKEIRTFNNIPQIGFIAQEVEKIIPEAVLKGNDGFLSINYQSLIPVLSEAIKEQQTVIESLKTELDDLKALVQKLTNAPVVSESDKFTINPNPVTGISVVEYNVAKNSRQIQFAIYDLQGKQLKIINVSNPQSRGTVQINKNELGKGMYILTLISGGQEIQSKKFIILE